MKENRHKAEDVLTRPWPGRQKEREDGERMEEKKSEKRTQINIKEEEEEEERKGTTECFRRKKKGDGER